MRLKTATFAIIAFLIFLTFMVMLSCDSNKKDGDYYYGLAMQALANDSVEEAFCKIDKAFTLYTQEGNRNKEANARIILGMLYFSNNLKEKAYELIKDLQIAPDDTCNYLLKSNYFRIMAYYNSLVEKNNDEALRYIETVINNDNFINEKERKPYLLVDNLNKTEFLINANRIDEAQELIREIESSSDTLTFHFPQLYVNKARIMEAKGLADSAYIYSEIVKASTEKVYRDADNLLAALQIMMHIDSIKGNFSAYIAHRDYYENILMEQIGDKTRLRLELLSNKNKMEQSEINHAHQSQLYILWGIIILCGFLLLILSIISKYKAAKKQEQLIQLECEKLDAECFKRKLECELYSRKMAAKDEEMRKINQDLLDLSYKLTHANKAQSTENANDHIARLQHKVQIDHPGFSKRMLVKFPTITKTELILAEFIRLNLNTQEIISLLNITQAGLIKSRYRLRKRLGVASSSELDSFIASF